MPPLDVRCAFLSPGVFFDHPRGRARVTLTYRGASSPYDYSTYIESAELYFEANVFRHVPLVQVENSGKRDGVGSWLVGGFQPPIGTSGDTETLIRREMPFVLCHPEAGYQYGLQGILPSLHREWYNYSICFPHLGHNRLGLLVFEDPVR